MTAVDHAELKRLADELVQMLAPDQGESAHPAFGHAVRIQNAHAALLSEIEGLKADRDEARAGRSIIAGGSMDMAVMYASANERADAAEAALRTQAPDSWRPDREAVARVLEPYWFTFADNGRYNATANIRCDVALARADDILALRPQTAESGK